jgi:hypothetical protein
MPYTGVVLTFVAIHAAAFLILLAHWVAAVGLFPQATENFAAQYTQRPLRAILYGILIFVAFVVMVAIGSKIPVPGLRNIIVGATILLPLLIAFIGSSGLALRIGRNLTGPAEPWRHVLRGGVMLALTFITPILGYFVLLPIGLVSGLGAFVLARPWKARVPPLPVTVPAPAALAPEAPASTAIPSLP